MGETLQELATQYGIKKPALYARLKKLERLYSELELSYKEGTTLYLTGTGKELLESDLKENPVKQQSKKSKKKSRTKKATRNAPASEVLGGDRDTELIGALRAQIRTLQSEMDIKNREIERLLATIDSLNATLKQALTESHSLTSQQQQIQAIELSKKESLTSGESHKKKSFISKLLVAGKLLRGDYD